MPTLPRTFDDIQSRLINATSRVVPMQRQIQGLKFLMSAKRKTFGPRRPMPEFVETPIPDVNTLALEDIDVSNLEELIWAMLTRSDPATSIDIIHDAWSTPLDPRIAPEEKEKGNFTNSRAIIDATRPFHWKDDFPPVNAPSPETMREAVGKWGYLCE